MQSYENDNQFKRGLEMAELDSAAGLSEDTKRNLREVACSAGGKAEFIRNYDGSVRIQARIEKLREQGKPDKNIFDILASEKLI